MSLLVAQNVNCDKNVDTLKWQSANLTMDFERRPEHMKVSGFGNVFPDSSLSYDSIDLKNRL